MPFIKLNKLFTHLLPFICLLWIVTGCSELSKITDNFPKDKSPNGMVKNKDYVILKRVRILDKMGFDRPVEAGSVLVPDGWRVEGGIRWKSINECRADIVSPEYTITSPDGAIQFSVLPSQSFVYSDDQMMQQSFEIGAQHGGCKVGEPFDASQYLQKLASGKLGAKVSNIRTDEATEDKINKFNQESNASMRQSGLQTSYSATVVYGNLAWNDGTKGLSQVGVSTITTDKPNMIDGGSVRFSTTTAFHQIVLRYKADREAEALKVFGTITTSSRTNPIWLQAKSDFLTRLGNIEHAGNMERIRLMGEQSRAYAKSQSDAADERMRNWEKQQSASDANQQRFIQTIREVETWKDSSGDRVELNAGYKYGWSKPDGTYILTDNSNFDPAVEFQQNWERMQKVQQ
ncbi:MAG TPA: hypothetical protein PKY82_21810 [Pyrinomonadaceae bacterium]|nr:hypothetical protein [Pyrinomonadaceae bacterium]